MAEMRNTDGNTMEREYGRLAFDVDEDVRFKAVTEDQVRAALARGRTMRHLRLGDALVLDGLITVEERDAALAKQRSQCHKQLGRIMVEAGLVRPEVLRRTLVDRLGVPRVDPIRFDIQPDAVALVPAEMARRLLAIPLYRNALRLTVALEDPMDWLAIGELERETGLKVDPVLASPAELRAALWTYY
jgi:hypothetical protein